MFSLLAEKISEVMRAFFSYKVLVNFFTSLNALTELRMSKFSGTRTTIYMPLNADPLSGYNY